MAENKRFELCVDSNNRKSIWDNENKEGEPLLCLNRFNEMWGIDEVYDLLNEQDTKIKKLEKSRDKWSALAENFSAFCDCYEKAINEVCDEETIEKIESKYAEYEEKVEIK